METKTKLSQQCSAFHHSCLTDFPNYEAGTWGPEEANVLLNDGHHWPIPADLSDNDI